MGIFCVVKISAEHSINHAESICVLLNVTALYILNGSKQLLLHLILNLCIIQNDCRTRKASKLISVFSVGHEVEAVSHYKRTKRWMYIGISVS